MVNERLTYRWQSKDFGQVIMICIGALGVSALHCDLGEVPPEKWTTLKSQVKKGDRLLAFRLGSSALLLLERPPSSLYMKSMVRLGNGLGAI